MVLEIGRKKNIKRKIYCLLEKVYHFNPWHCDPAETRPYAVWIIHYLNKMIVAGRIKQGNIIEVGCGLGDIIGSVSWKQGKKGYDLEKEVISAARWLHPRVQFQQGTFSDVKSDKNRISCLIMVDFIHTLSPEDLRENIQTMLENNTVDMFVLDTFSNTQGTVYKYSHDGQYLYGENYRLVKKSRSFEAANGARRYVEVWKRK